MTAKPINWAGFYVLDKDVATSSSTSTAAETKPKKDALILGPFQGKVACTNIVFGRGVCGTAAAENRTLVVKDVHNFPGHIACDSASNSEIVVPLELDGVRLIEIVLGHGIETGSDACSRQYTNDYFFTRPSVLSFCI